MLIAAHIQSFVYLCQNSHSVPGIEGCPDLIIQKRIVQQVKVHSIYVIILYPLYSAQTFSFSPPYLFLFQSKLNMSRPVVRPVVKPRVVPAIASVSTSNVKTVPIKTQPRPSVHFDPQSYDSYDSDDLEFDASRSTVVAQPNDFRNGPALDESHSSSTLATSAAPVAVPKITAIRVPGVRIAPRNEAKIPQLGKRDDSFLDQLSVKRSRPVHRKSLRDFLWNDGDGTPSAVLAERAQIVLSRRRESSRSGSAIGQPSSHGGVAASLTDNKMSTFDDDYTAADTGGAKLQIVDGRVVVEAESLIQTFDVSSQGLHNMTEVDEDVGDSAFITSSSFANKKRVRVHNWGVEDTRKFYEALRMCGTDFGLISSLFPDRSRRDIKSKYNREEKMVRIAPLSQTTRSLILGFHLYYVILKHDVSIRRILSWLKQLSDLPRRWMCRPSSTQWKLRMRSCEPMILTRTNNSTAR